MTSTKFPTAKALVLAKALRRAAGESGDLPLARWANDLHREAMLAIRRRQSVLNDPRPANSSEQNR